MSLGLDSENWRAIDGYLNYQVSDLGRVRNTKSGKIHSPGLCKNGYYVVGPTADKKRKPHYIHHLVAHAFIPNPENKNI